MSARREITLGARRNNGLQDLDASQPNGGFAERQRTTFIGPTDRECRLLIDDEPLGRVEGSVNEWTWTPGFYAGEVRAELLDADDRSLGVWLLDVSPDQSKTGRDVFARMIDEILDFDAHLVIGEEPARRRLGTLGDADDPLIQFERLRRRQRDLERSLTAIRREPVSVLRARREVRPSPRHPACGSAHASVRASATGHARGHPTGYRDRSRRSRIGACPRRTGRRTHARFPGEPVRPRHAARAASQVQRTRQEAGWSRKGACGRYENRRRQPRRSMESDPR